MNIKKETLKKTALLKVLNRHCHCTEKRPDLTRSAIWIFSSCLTPLPSMLASYYQNESELKLSRLHLSKQYI